MEQRVALPLLLPLGSSVLKPDLHSLSHLYQSAFSSDAEYVVKDSVYVLHIPVS